jgi:N-acetylneuraminate synthase
VNQEIRFGNITLSEIGPVVIIAEAACEHQGSLIAAKQLVDLAKESGAGIVKFQMHLPDQEMIPDSIHFWAGSMDEVLDKVNLKPEDHVELIKYCKQVGIQYLCTPFCAPAADALASFGVDAFKIGSGELTNIPMQRHVARLGKPMIVSTGMATLDEIAETVAALKEEKATFMLTHCVSAYPPRYEQINLGMIRRLKEMFGVMVGYSDHTAEIWSTVGAVVAGARVIEKHFTPDHALKGPDHHISLEPREFRVMVDAIRKLEVALGAEKKVQPEEEPVRQWAHHSVVSVRDIVRGVRITPDMIGVKRPGWGVPAKHLPEFYGRTARKNIPANSLLKWEDVE